jgi:hypothetical protein
MLGLGKPALSILPLRTRPDGSHSASGSAMPRDQTAGAEGRAAPSMCTTRGAVTRL